MGSQREGRQTLSVDERETRDHTSVVDQKGPRFNREQQTVSDTDVDTIVSLMHWPIFHRRTDCGPRHHIRGGQCAWVGSGGSYCFFWVLESPILPLRAIHRFLVVSDLSTVTDFELDTGTFAILVKTNPMSLTNTVTHFVSFFGSIPSLFSPEEIRGFWQRSVLYLWQLGGGAHH